jgi:hypothetical protein
MIRSTLCKSCTIVWSWRVMRAFGGCMSKKRLSSITWNEKNPFFSLLTKWESSSKVIKRGEKRLHAGDRVYVNILTHDDPIKFLQHLFSNLTCILWHLDVCLWNVKLTSGFVVLKWNSLFVCLSIFDEVWLKCLKYFERKF